MFGNIFYKVDTAFQIGGGRDNNISNNIMLSSGRSVTLDERGLNWAAQNVAPGGAWGMYDLLAAVPYQKEPWRSRYPNLVNIADDQPAVPEVQRRRVQRALHRRRAGHRPFRAHVRNG